MNSWKNFDITKVKAGMQIKTTDNRTHTVWSVIGSKVFVDNMNEGVETSDIKYFREKQDMNRFKEINSAYELLNKVSFKFDGDDLLMDIENALFKAFGDGKRYDKVEKIFVDLRNLIDEANYQMIKESKTYLK